MLNSLFYQIVFLYCCLSAILPLCVFGQFETGHDDEEFVSKQKKEIELKSSDLAIIDSRIHDFLEFSGILVNDHTLLSYLNSCASSLYNVGETNGRAIQVKVINSPELNAFSLSDGTIYVNLAILGLIENEAQLAFLLAHEIAHISHDHHKAIKYEMHAQALKAAQGQIVGSIFGIGISSQNTVKAALCGFSRNQEYKADSIAIRKISSKAYNAWKAKDLLSTMHEWLNYKERNVAIEYATHPQLHDRLNKIISIANKGDTVSGNDGTSEYQSIVSPLYGKITDLLLVSNSSKELYKFCLRMISLNRTMSEWHYLKGKILERYSPVDSFRIAYQSLTNSIQYDPDCAKAFRETAWLFLKNNNKDSAALYLKKYLNNNPDASDKHVIQFYLRNME